jgi:hypothetical protein
MDLSPNTPETPPALQEYLPSPPTHTPTPNRFQDVIDSVLGDRDSRWKKRAREDDYKQSQDKKQAYEEEDL